MNISIAFVRTFFVLLSIIFMLTYVAGTATQLTTWTWIWGVALGIGIGGALIALDFVFRRFHLRSFNVAVVGLFFGYLMSLALLAIFNALIDVSTVHLHPEVIDVFKIFLLLFGTYLGVAMTLRSANEIYVSLPFVKFTPAPAKIKSVLVDYSALCDTRLIDLASSGLLDRKLIVPRFLLKLLNLQDESSDEGKSRQALELLRKLETLPALGLAYNDTDFPEAKDPVEKVLRLARLLDADVLSADVNPLQQASAEGVRIINLHNLSNCLRPLRQRGEMMKIKIQRKGKEEMQGVGYLEDGTMVVVNGAGEFIGRTIQTRVLSAKTTVSGRMVFCNVAEGEEQDGEEE